MKKVKLTFIFLLSILMGNAQCDPGSVNHYNEGDFPFISSSGITVTMTGSYSGPAGPYGPFGCSPATIDPNSLRVEPGDTLIFSFSQPIHELTFVSGAMNATENAIISTNNGIPSLSSNCPQDVVITGNAYALGATSPLSSPLITITIPNGATSITIVCLPATNNGIFTIDMLDCISSCNTSSNLTLSACDSLISPSGNYTWTTSGTYNDTIANSLSCDSVISINLTILNSSLGTDTLVACDSLTWIDGVTYYQNNNSATYTLINTSGCDSVVTLNLNILHSSSGTDIITACDSLTWINGINYYQSNNTATHTLTNANGCDSIVNLDLNILYSNTGIDILTACDSLTWIDGITYFQSNNTATHTLTNNK